MNIKTFPLLFTEEKHKQIKACADAEGKSLKQFILDAIDHEIIDSEGK